MDFDRIRRVIHDAEQARDQLEGLISDLEDLIDDHESGSPDERAALQQWNEWARSAGVPS